MKVHMLNGIRKHDFLGIGVVDEPPSYMVRYNLHTMENDIEWLQDHTSANQEYPEWWKSQLTEASDRLSTSRSFLDYAIDERFPPLPEASMNGLNEVLIPLEEEIKGAQIKPAKESLLKPAIYTALSGIAIYALFGGNKA